MSKAVYPSLKGKLVVVTGGGSGIGAGVTEAFFPINRILEHSHSITVGYRFQLIQTCFGNEFSAE